MRLKNKVAVITGSTVGIGFATAKRFLSEGAKVAICGRTQTRVDAALEQLKPLGDVEGYVADVSKKDDISNMVGAFAQKHNNRIDILVNNAGITMDAQFYKMTDEQFEQVIDTNLKSVYYCTKAVLPYMMEKSYGKIISTASVSAFNGNFGQSNYAAAKAGIIGMTRVLARELGKFNINVNCVSPGLVLTEMTAKIPQKIMKQKEDLIPLKRVGQPEEVASLFAFLASDDACFITGMNIVIDGGRN